MSTHVLVTGGSGFIGSHLVDRLVESGYEVTVLDNLTEQVHDAEPAYLNPRAEYVWGDVRDRAILTSLLERCDVVSHQASAVGVGQSMYEIERYADVNTLGTARLLDCIVNEDIDIEKVVVASSMSIYGEGEYYCPECEAVKHPPVRSEAQLQRDGWELVCPDGDHDLEPKPTPESTPLDSNSIYAITKRDQEEMALTIGRAYGITTVALRYFNVYGSRQALDNPYTGVCAIFSSRIVNDNPPLVFEDGEQTRDFVHVSDVARANELAIETDDANGHAVNVGTGSPRTIAEVGRTLLTLYGKADTFGLAITNRYRAGDIRHCYPDMSEATGRLGFEPRVDFETGMAELVSWGRRQDAHDNVEQAQAELSERGLLEDT